MANLKISAAPYPIALKNFAQLYGAEAIPMDQVQSAATFTGTLSGTTLTMPSVTGTIAIGQYVNGWGVKTGCQITAGAGLSWTVNQNYATAITGAMSSGPLQTVNAPIAALFGSMQISYPTGLVTIAAAASTGALRLNGAVGGDPILQVNAASASATDRGIQHVFPANYNIFNTFNDGHFILGWNGTAQTISGSAAGNVTIPPPSSGVTLTVTGGVAATAAVQINTPSDYQLSLNASSGQYTTLQWLNAGTQKAQIYWDNTGVNWFFGTPVASSTIKFANAGNVQAFGTNANQTFIVGKGTAFASSAETANRAVLQLNGQTGGDSLIDFAVNGANKGYLYCTAGGAEMRLLSEAGSCTMYTSGVLAATFATGGNLTTVGTCNSTAFNLTGGTLAGIGSGPNTFGSITLSGSLGGYAGIQFTSAFGAQGRTLMVANGSAIQGFYDSNAGAWDWYFNAGVLTVGKVPAASVNAGALANGMTATTQATADATTDLATDAFVHNVADPTLTLAANGKWNEVTGIQVRWGFIAASGDPKTVTYSSAFPNGSYAVVGSCANTSGGNTFEIDSTGGITATGFQCFTGGASAYYIAIGH